jgi:hypothetical protein
MFPDAEVLPYSQIGASTKEGTSSLKVPLDAKLAIVRQLSRSVGVDAGHASAAGDIGQVKPVVQAYSQAVAPLISTQLTQQTKDAILTETRYLLDRLGNLEEGLTSALGGNRLQGDAVLHCVIMSKQVKTAKLCCQSQTTKAT